MKFYIADAFTETIFGGNPACFRTAAIFHPTR